RRAKRLIGQERQNDDADHGELEGRLHVFELDPARQPMQVVLQGKEQKADNGCDAGHPDSVPAAQSADNESYDRATFSAAPHLAPGNSQVILPTPQSTGRDESREQEQSLIQLVLQESADRT